MYARHIFKQFCPKGHDKSITGITIDGHCRECKREYSKVNKILYYEKNRSALKEKHKIYYLENTEKIKAYNKEYAKNHPEIARLSELKSKGCRSLRVPKFGQDGILEFYRNMPNDMTVDHIIPLQGKLVSGLHVIWNLQYLTKSQNSKKHNTVNLIEISDWYGKNLGTTTSTEGRKNLSTKQGRSR